MKAPYEKGGSHYWVKRLCMATAAAACVKCKCGGHAMMHQRADQTEWQVTCSQCNVAARKRKTRIGALSAWVRRVTKSART